MAEGEYFLALLAIITGLAITDMVVSLHGLLLNRRYVKWDWLAPMAAGLVFILIVYGWGISFRAFSHESAALPLWYFVLTLVSVIPWYLAARAALPDHVQIEQEIDLSEHYDFVSRYLWSAILASHVIYLLMVIYDTGLQRLPGALPFLWPTLLGIFLMTPLIIWTRRSLHRILVPILFVFACVQALPAPMLG